MSALARNASSTGPRGRRAGSPKNVLQLPAAEHVAVGENGQHPPVAQLLDRGAHAAEVRRHEAHAGRGPNLVYEAVQRGRRERLREHHHVESQRTHGADHVLRAAEVRGDEDHAATPVVRGEEVLEAIDGLEAVDRPLGRAVGRPGEVGPVACRAAQAAARGAGALPRRRLRCAGAAHVRAGDVAQPR